MMRRAGWTSLVIVIGIGACAEGAGGDDPDAASDPGPRAITSDAGTFTTRDGGSTKDANPPREDASLSQEDGGVTDGAPSPNAQKRVFVTSTKYYGNLGGGAAGADSKCTKSAQIALLGGTWKAWISDSTTDAEDRIADVGPWYTVDGKTKMYDDVFDLIDKPLALDSYWRDELGNSTPEQIEVWTGTEDGESSGDDCDDWSSNTGFGTYTNLWQAYSASRHCSDKTFRLLCVEQ